MTRVAHIPFPWALLPSDTSPLSVALPTHTAPPESSVGSVMTYLLGAHLLELPADSAWPLAQRLVTKKMASGDQPSWLGGVRLFTRPGCPPNNPARACCPDNGPLLPRARTRVQRWALALAGPPCARGLMEQPQCGPTGPLGGTSRVSALGEKVLGPLFSFLCPLSTAAQEEPSCPFTA